MINTNLQYLNKNIAMVVGMEPAIVLDMIIRKVEYESNFTYENKKWIRMSYEEWHQIFPFFSGKSIQRYTKKLQKMGFIEIMLEPHSFDKRLCMTVNDEAIKNVLGDKKYIVYQ